MAAPGKLYLIPSLLFPETAFETLPVHISEIIRQTNIFLVENERSARRFISSLDLKINIENLRLFRLDKDTLPVDIQPVIDLILKGENVGVISEAGCPGVADPGSLAVHLAHQNDITVIPLVGPSSILLALMASGFNGQSFVFHGYLPIERAERQMTLKRIEQEATSKRQTQIFIETPYRNASLFADILQICQPDTQLCVACDITAPDQYLKTMTLSKWKKATPDLNKRPTVFLIF